MRVLSASAVVSAFSQETDKVYLAILSLDHTDLVSPIYAVANTENVTSNGTEYLAYPFKIDLPPDTSEEVVRVTLTIDNIDRSIVEAVRTCTGRPSVSLSIILADSPDTIEAGPFEFSLVGAVYDELIVSGELSYEDILSEPYPGNIFSPAEFFGLF